MTALFIILMFLFVFFLGYHLTGKADRFIRKNCSPFSNDCSWEPDIKPETEPDTRSRKKRKERKVFHLRWNQN